MDPVTWTSVGLAGAGTGLVALAATRGARSLSLLVVGVAGLVAGLMGLVGASLSTVVAAFLVVAVAGGVLAWRWRTLLAEGSRLPPGAGATRLVGMPGLVEVDVPAQAAAGGAVVGRGAADGDRQGIVSGRVRVGGEVWRAETSDDRALPTGSAVVVTGVRGARVVVTAAPSTGATSPPSTPVTRET